MKRKDFQGLAALRLKEARVLLENNCWEGAYYLGGYAVECALKACIARQTERHEFPDRERVQASYTHDLERLIVVAGLRKALEAATNTDTELNKNWTIVRDWWEQSRYERPSQVQAENLVKAVGDRRQGVLRWLRRFW